jgi:hypothetical protein
VERAYQPGLTNNFVNNASSGSTNNTIVCPPTVRNPRPTPRWDMGTVGDALIPPSASRSKPASNRCLRILIRRHWMRF